MFGKLAGRDLGVFLRFPGFCSLFAPKPGGKTEEKGNKISKFPSKRPMPGKNEPMRLIFTWHKGTKTGKTFENAQLPKAPGFLDSYYLFITGRVLS